MGKNNDYITLVKQAQTGDKQCLDRLSELAVVRLRSHVYRLTLKEDITQDIVQESIMEMIKIIGKLKKADRFWPWLYGISHNKLRRYHRNENRHNGKKIQEIGFSGAEEDKQAGLENLLADELKQIISRAMTGLKPAHRTVLSMRCYDEMSYDEIAGSLGCSKFAAQMLFYRAKRSLAKQLSKQGLGKGALLTVLLLFGKMTASSEAAAAQLTISASTVKVGFAAAAAATALSKTTLLSVTAAAVIAAGAAVMPPAQNNRISQNQKQTKTTQNTNQQIARTNQDIENWYFFPGGTDNPMMTRTVALDSDNRKSYCRILQNQYANYHYVENSGLVNINNYRAWAPDMSVKLLPTDDPEFVKFITDIQGIPEGDKVVEHVTGKGQGSFVIASNNKTEGPTSLIDRHANMLQEEYFKFDWPTDVRIVDNRDQMHKRGWTYFTIKGSINENTISGRGRIPFVYEHSAGHDAWIEVNTAGRTFMGTSAKAFIITDGKEQKAYPAGSFFEGLSRPWMGFHTIDSIRRDAAKHRLGFKTTQPDEQHKSTVTVTAGGISLTYTIDMELDVLEKITLYGDNVKGTLNFEYMQDIESKEHRFARPTMRRSPGDDAPPEGLLWLLELAE